MKYKWLKLLISIMVICILFSSCNGNKKENIDERIENNRLPNDEIEELRLDSIISMKKPIEYSNDTNFEDFNTIFFGHYENDNDSNNGKEPIEWIILENQDDKLLLLSKYIIDAVKYNDQNRNVDFYNSSIRNWLNTTFYNESFDDEERNAIIRRHCSNENINEDTILRNKGVSDECKSSDDLVSLISYREIIKYFGKIDNKQNDQFHNRKILAKATPFARTEKDMYGTAIDIEKSSVWYKGCSPYWLRSTFSISNASFTNLASIVDLDGTVSYKINNDLSIGLRPIIQIDLLKLNKAKRDKMVSKFELNNNKTLNSNEKSLQKEEDLQVKTISEIENSFEMKFFKQALVEFEDEFNEQKNKYFGKYKELYISEIDGTTKFTYGLRDVDKDNIKELLIYNKNNLIAIYRLENDYYEDYEKHDEMYYPVLVDSVYWFYNLNGNYDDSIVTYIYNDNLINTFTISTARFDTSDLIAEGVLSSEQIEDIYNYRNYTEYYYNTKYVSGDEYEIYCYYDFQTNSEDGLGEFVDKDYNTKRISLAEADIKFNSHGEPIVLNDGILLIK